LAAIGSQKIPGAHVHGLAGFQALHQAGIDALGPSDINPRLGLEDAVGHPRAEDAPDRPIREHRGIADREGVPSDACGWPTVTGTPFQACGTISSAGTMPPFITVSARAMTTGTASVGRPS
jgi:hypothetical protein